MGSIGAGELLLIFLVALLLFGPGRLPELGRAFGKAAREFKKAEAEVRNAMAAGTNDDPKGAPPSEKDPGERSE
ncbi:MAG TPA: twin-arginine translocase TatA/TatE family subunit [Acidobacteriota bacterium]|nr:twin-arginine translocase TatA/TatE family subunit [Acidobacteriota bacterium]HNT16758.1 twin-arginine translocase TatA/TatE family subunit [Acidobacteriota bacterium]